jgi:hypothetical protein
MSDEPHIDEDKWAELTALMVGNAAAAVARGVPVSVAETLATAEKVRKQAVADAEDAWVRVPTATVAELDEKLAGLQETVNEMKVNGTGDTHA